MKIVFITIEFFWSAWVLTCLPSYGLVFMGSFNKNSNHQFEKEGMKFFGSKKYLQTMLFSEWEDSFSWNEDKFVHPLLIREWGFVLTKNIEPTVLRFTTKMLPECFNESFLLGRFLEKCYCHGYCCLRETKKVEEKKYR